MYNPFEELWTYCVKCNKRIRLKDAIPTEEPFKYLCRTCNAKGEEDETQAQVS